MKIFLVRHGDKQVTESTDRLMKNSVLLSQLGIKQVEALSEYLKNNYSQLQGQECIFSSLIPRAVQTAEILRSNLKIKEIILSPALIEYYPTTNFSLSKEIRNEMYRQTMNDIDLIPDIKVSFRTGILSLLNFIKDNYRGDNSILISSHGALIRNSIYFLFPEYKPPLDKILESGIHNAGVTILNYDGQNFSLEKFDLADHLLGMETK